MTLPQELYTSLGAGTAEQQALVMQAIAAQMTYNVENGASSVSPAQSFASQWSQCTGMPLSTSLGIIGALNLVVTLFTAPAAAVASEPTTVALWVAFAAFLASSLITVGLASVRTVKGESRASYYGVALISVSSALAYAYVVMALEGSLSTVTGWNGVRQVFWLRYANWAVAAPVGLTLLGLLSGAHWTSILSASFYALLGIGAAFACAISPGFNAVWPLFTFALLFGFLPVFGALVSTWRRSAYAIHPENGKLYDFVAWLLVILVLGYIIVLGCGDAGNVMSVDAVSITWFTFDIITLSLLGLFLISGRESIARYGSPLAWLNTGMAIDFAIPRSLYTSSADNYRTEPGTQLTQVGEPRDLAFARLRSSLSIAPTSAKRD